MPELPEVETIRRDLEDIIIDRKISAVKLHTPKSARHKAAFFINTLLGRRIKSIQRRGKLLIFELSKRKEDKETNYLLVHLKMTGQLIYKEKKGVIAGGHSEGDLSTSKENLMSLPNKHTRAQISINNGGNLFFNDLRRFGYLQIVSKSILEEIKEKNYGPEPLTSDFNVNYLRNSLKKRTTNIKAILLNQKIVAGLGNIYVDEALFLAGIKPMRKGLTITKKETKLLLEKINEVIAFAIEKRGTTFNNYRDSAGRRGNFLNLLNVYGRKGEPCKKCKRPIEKIKLAGRGTHYCPYCQK